MSTSLAVRKPTLVLCSHCNASLVCLPSNSEGTNCATMNDAHDFNALDVANSKRKTQQLTVNDFLSNSLSNPLPPKSAQQDRVASKKKTVRQMQLQARRRRHNSSSRFRFASLKHSKMMHFARSPLIWRTRRW